MAVNYVFQFGAYVIPNEYIAEGGYEVAPNQRQDLDPYTDANGVTHRNTLEHTKSDITIAIRSLGWEQFTSLINGLVTNYLSNERDAICSYLDMETMTMGSGHFYLDPSCKFKVVRINDKVDAFTLRFTEY